MTTEVQQDDQLTPDQIAEQEERDFLSAANGEDPEPSAEPEQQSADQEAGDQGDNDTPIAAESGDSDINLSDLPQSVLEKLEAQMMEKLAPQIEQRLSGRLRNIEGNLGGMRQSLQQLSAAAKTAEAQGADAPTGSQMREAMQSGDKMAKLKEDFPEFAEALEETFSGIASRIPQLDMNALDQRFQSTQQAIAHEAMIARQMARLDAAHPDWEKTVQDETYINWLRNQPADIQDLAENSLDASDAIRVLNAYHAATKTSEPDLDPEPDLTAQSRQRNRLESAVTPTSGSQVTRRQQKTEHDEFLAAFNS